MAVRRDDLTPLIKDLQAWLDQAGEVVGSTAVEVVHEHFDAEALIGEATWPPRLPDTPRNDRKLLSDTGTLRDEVDYQVEGDQVRVGLDLAIVPYAQLHNEGGEIAITPKMKAYFWARYLETGNMFYKRLALSKGRFVMPARPFLRITDYMTRRIEEALDQHLKTHVP